MIPIGIWWHIQWRAAICLCTARKIHGLFSRGRIIRLQNLMRGFRAFFSLGDDWYIWWKGSSLYWSFLSHMILMSKSSSDRRLRLVSWSRLQLKKVNIMHDFPPCSYNYPWCGVHAFPLQQPANKPVLALCEKLKQLYRSFHEHVCIQAGGW